jgi:cell filamentation protein, protein adenylyltransferase
MTPQLTFEVTHPWISFEIDLQRAPATLWLALGECQSKCDHIAKVPLRPDTRKNLHLIYLAKGALATTAIEGNTLSEDEVLQHLEGKLKLPPSRQYLGQEVDNIIARCNAILEDVQKGSLPALTPSIIQEHNKIVLQGLSTEDDVVPGNVRKHEVGFPRYRGAPAEDCEYLLQKMCDWLNGEKFNAPPGAAAVYAILKAILAHLYLAWIHPFGDGNGRTARLAEFQILITSGVPAPAAHLLSNHYNQTRAEYYRQLDRASRSGGDILPFITYAVEGFRDGLVSQQDYIWEQVWDVTWQNYVHEKFEDSAGTMDRRRKFLLMDLSGRLDEVPLNELHEVSPRVSALYARVGKRTLSRDVLALEKEGLVERTATGIRARKELILELLPTTASADI